MKERMHIHTIVAWGSFKGYCCELFIPLFVLRVTINYVFAICNFSKTFIAARDQKKFTEQNYSLQRI